MFITQNQLLTVKLKYNVRTSNPFLLIDYVDDDKAEDIEMHYYYYTKKRSHIDGESLATITHDQFMQHKIHNPFRRIS